MDKQIVFADDTHGNVNLNESDIVYGTHQTSTETMNLYVDKNVDSKPAQHKRLTKLVQTDSLASIDLDGDTRRILETAGAGDHAGYTLILNIDRIKDYKRDASGSFTRVWIEGPGAANVPVLQVSADEATLLAAINALGDAAYAN